MADNKPEKAKRTKPTFEALIKYLKITLIVLLVVIEMVVCAKAWTDRVGVPSFVILIFCCVALAAVEAANTFAVEKFVAKMVFFGIDSALLLTVCILTGNTFLSTLYCIVLTGCYMTVDRFRDKTILFGCSCGLFIVSCIVGWVIANPDTDIYRSILDITSGVLFGLLAMAIDYAVVIFLLKFYNTNRELSQALKEADESKTQLKSVYEQLTQTKVYEERNRIAKDIHDNAGHSMTTVIMQTEAAKLLIDTDPAEAKNRIISANIQARNALEQMRDSVHLLAGREHTRALRDEIEEIISQTFDSTDIRARYNLADVHPDGDAHRFILNTLKELLANGIRHGSATAFYIELKEESGWVSLIVSDNGKGVKGNICEGFGLKGIREKAEKMGGACRFTSEEGEGFEAEIKLPAKAESEEQL